MKTQIARKKEEPSLGLVGRESVPAGSDNGEVLQRVALRAYELYRERGDHDGQALDDWLQAERDILRAMRQE